MLAKIKNYFTDPYSLYIIKYLFEETYNRELLANNNLIFSSDIDKQIIKNYNVDNFLILKSKQKKQTSKPIKKAFIRSNQKQI